MTESKKVRLETDQFSLFKIGGAYANKQSDFR